MAHGTKAEAVRGIKAENMRGSAVCSCFPKLRLNRHAVSIPACEVRVWLQGSDGKPLRASVIINSQLRHTRHSSAPTALGLLEQRAGRNPSSGRYQSHLTSSGLRFSIFTFTWETNTLILCINYHWSLSTVCSHG